jgi:hypothetical protein
VYLQYSFVKFIRVQLHAPVIHSRGKCSLGGTHVWSCNVQDMILKKRIPINRANNCNIIISLKVYPYFRWLTQMALDLIWPVPKNSKVELS